MPKLQRPKVFGMLLRKMTDAFVESTSSGAAASLPPPSEVIKKFRMLSILRLRNVLETLLRMACALPRVLHEGQNMDHSHFKHAVQELMQLWAIHLQEFTRRLSNGPQSDPYELVTESDWSGYVTKPGVSKDFEACLLRFMLASVDPSYRENKFYHRVAFSCLPTLHVLKHWSQIDGDTETLRRYDAFRHSIERILNGTTMSNRTIYKIRSMLTAEGLSDDLATNIVPQTPTSPPTTVDSDSAKNEAPTPEDIDATAEKVIAHLGRAAERQNLDFAEKLWNDAQPFLRQVATQCPDRPSVRKLYENFMSTYLTLKRLEAAHTVWRAMVASGCQPTVRSWTILLRGTQAGKDVHLMNALWDRMRGSGIQPDIAAWSTRILKLFRCNKHHQGFNALDQLGREWGAAVRKYQQDNKTNAKTDGESRAALPNELSGVPKPNSLILNAAISGLASQAAHNIPKVLAWARTYSIEPDVVTYNVLINVSMKQGRVQEGTALLQRMAEKGIRPDGSTFTILLNSLFHSEFLDELTHDQQATKVMSWITSVESSTGTPMDIKTYALLMDRLIKHYSNLSAAHKVLAHMLDQGVQPTVHIYTPLMTHYFQQDPPNLAAADALWAEIRSRKHYTATLDVVFFDRMVEGYARAGDVGTSMSLLARMSKEGKRPGWPALTAVVRALAQHQDWDRVRELAQDVQRWEGLASVGMRGTAGMEEFWETLRGMGIS